METSFDIFKKIHGILLSNHDIGKGVVVNNTVNEAIVRHDTVVIKIFVRIKGN